MISVICPVFNEAPYIDGLISFFLNAEPAEKELLLVDGGSSDNTVELIANHCTRHPEIRLLYNPDKYVPFALNLAIRAAKGDPIIRLDAHTKYAPDYFTKILEVFQKTRADIVGGPTRTACANSFQCAVGYAISTPLGVGDSKVHDDTFEGYVDSVTFGAWRRDIFKDVGYFDEQLMRNQDDEFHYRAKSKGKKLYLDPGIRLWYYPRDTVKGLFRQYFQYGLYKPLVLKKVKSEMKLRHLAPSGFVLYLITLPITILYGWWLVPLGLYILFILTFAFRFRSSFVSRLWCLAVYPLIHIGYGSGFILGLLK